MLIQATPRKSLPLQPEFGPDHLATAASLYVLIFLKTPKLDGSCAFYQFMAD